MQFYAVVVILFAINSVHSAPFKSREQQESTGLTTYDQKQTGKYNIHLNIKDVAIIALGSDHVDSGIGDFGEDYYEDYDLSDFTIKPIYGLVGFDPTTAKPNATETSEDEKPTEEESTDTVVQVTSNTIKPPSNTTDVATNKTQNVVILSQSTTPTAVSSVTILNYNDTSNQTGIVITTSTPSKEDLPPKISLVQSPPATQKPVPTLSVRPGEIPVQIIMEPVLQSTSHVHKNRSQANYRLRNRVRVNNSNRRITPPTIQIDEIEDTTNADILPVSGYAKLRRNVNDYRKRCAGDRTGKCHTGRRSSMNGLLNLLSYLTPREN